MEAHRLQIFLSSLLLLHLPSQKGSKSKHRLLIKNQWASRDSFPPILASVVVFQWLVADFPYFLVNFFFQPPLISHRANTPGKPSAFPKKQKNRAATAPATFFSSKKMHPCFLAFRSPLRCLGRLSGVLCVLRFLLSRSYSWLYVQGEEGKKSFSHPCNHLLKLAFTIPWL